jgi:hypothetical protein
MLKWVFAAFVLANVGAAMWLRWYMEPPVNSDVARPAFNADKLKLLGEPGAKPRARPKPAEPAPEAVSTEPAPACYRAGPYAELDAAVAAGKRLEERGISSMRREETSRAISGYRVFLPPFSSKQAAEARRRELVRMGFTDNALVQEGGRFGISLGLFSIEVNATNHMKRLSAKGVRARMEPVQHARAAYWLELSGENLFETLKDFDWSAVGVALAEYPCAALPVAEPVLAPDP